LVREQSARLAAVFDDPPALLRWLEEMAERFRHGCSVNPRKKKPNTCQLLENAGGYGLS
jgi:hypothetical protein